MDAALLAIKPLDIPAPRYRARNLAESQAVQHELQIIVRNIIEQRLLHAVLQPIVATRSGEIIGYEGLIRGPVDSPLHMPAWLFSVAERFGLQSAVELLSREIVIETFAGMSLPGKLFLNVSPELLTQSSASSGNLVAFLQNVGLPPERVIIELTENQPTPDLAKMREALLHYRGLGFEVAIDDLGEGFSSLRLWSELRPEFVKIDKHFIHGVCEDNLKLEFVRAIQQIASCCGSHVIAEGIETRQDFRVIRDLGIAYSQGYFIAKPDAIPAREATAEARKAVQDCGIAVYPGIERVSNRAVKARKLMIAVEPVAPETENDRVCELFENDPDLISLPVVKDRVPVGLIHRYALIDRFARPFRKEIYGRRPCTIFMQTAPLVVEHDLSIEELSAVVSESDPRNLADGFIITDGGFYLGIGTARDLIREITQMQINAARYANPLTLLPGNVPISEHIERLLNAGARFSACYCDIDNFKPFNDVFGYQMGDEVIRLAARVLAENCDPERDFIGHIGGDDFIVMFQSTDWEGRCRAALKQFAELMPSLLNEDNRARGHYVSEDRRGVETTYPFPTVSIGAVEVPANTITTHLEVSSAATHAKKQAKRETGNSFFVERRNLFA